MRRWPFQTSSRSIARFAPFGEENAIKIEVYGFLPSLLKTSLSKRKHTLQAEIVTCLLPSQSSPVFWYQWLRLLFGPKVQPKSRPIGHVPGLLKFGLRCCVVRQDLVIFRFLMYILRSRLVAEPTGIDRRVNDAHCDMARWKIRSGFLLSPFAGVDWQRGLWSQIPWITYVWPILCSIPRSKSVMQGANIKRCNSVARWHSVTV